MSVVFWKELADHFSSRRFMILLIIIILSGFWATYATGQAIRQNTDTVPVQYVFLLLLTSSGETLFSLARATRSTGATWRSSHALSYHVR